MPIGMRSAGLMAAAATLVLAGCTPAAQADVRVAAQRFQTAVRDHDGQTACALLSDQARSSLEATSARACPDALAALRLPADHPTDIQVWGNNAQARLTGGPLFLAEFQAGWKITGAGCRPQTDQPYACAVRS